MFCSADSLSREFSGTAVNVLRAIWLRHLLFHLSSYLKLNFPACHRPHRSLSAARTHSLIKATPPHITSHFTDTSCVVCLCCKTQTDLTPWPHLMKVMKSAAAGKCRPPPCARTHIHRRGKMLKGVVTKGSRGLFSTISMCPSWGKQEFNSEVCPKEDISHFMACLSLC